jgi:cytosine/adenosine deaminase-related metal-dependent hydrolase
VGSIKAGKRADFLVIDVEAPHNQGNIVGNPRSSHPGNAELEIY